MEHRQIEAVRAEIRKNEDGRFMIAFEDPAYVRSDCVYMNDDDKSLYILMQELSFLIGEVTEDMLKDLNENEKVLLSALLPDGKNLELHSPLYLKRGN